MSDQEQTPQTQDAEPKVEDPNAPINVKVTTQTGEEVFFKIKRNTKLSKLQGAYANKVGKDVNSIRGRGLGMKDLLSLVFLTSPSVSLRSRFFLVVFSLGIYYCVPVNHK
ncbi:hypothetical protein BN946_scf185033.g30 [Trametes cinnabarina]|uniref:Rad60/SUMO-like domain-containing protein n=1 Tax=Pycnoporus cinnabarinus TaxID=5643 RepID=A0A060SWI2_PYCCI|nr:hypothetical protein BN946_scf185033.g30 [Trametes cinnabarina]